MKTTTIFGIIAIIAAFGIMGSTIGTGVFSQQAHAAGATHIGPFEFGNCVVKGVETPSGVLNVHEHCSK